MKYWKQKLKYGLAVVTTTALPAVASAAELQAEQLTGGISKGQDILIAVAGAMFTIVGIYVAYRWGRKAAGG